MSNQPTLDVLTFQMESVKKQKLAIIERLDKLEEARRAIQLEIRSEEGKLPALTTEMVRLNGLIRAFQESEPVDTLLSDILAQEEGSPEADTEVLLPGRWYKIKKISRTDPDFVFRTENGLNCPGIKGGFFFHDGFACVTPFLWEEAKSIEVANAVYNLKNPEEFHRWESEI